MELNVEEDLATKLSIILPLGNDDDGDDHDDGKMNDDEEESA